MAAEDVQQLEVQEGDVVDVVSETGRMRVVVALADLPPGNLAMYYPEANVLVPRKIDAASGTPAFKSVLCRIEVRPGTPPAARA
jgi:anaerobic selenocysteine-containing dehydrogenase